MMQVRSLSNPLRIPDLRRRLLFPAFLLVLPRRGAPLPVPGVDVRALQQLFQQQGGLLSFYDLFVGGALSHFALFALGVFPYITAAILSSRQTAIPDARPLMLGTIVITPVAGPMLLTWMGEIMTEHGVGNGVSLIIFGGIVARLPAQTGRTIVLLRAAELGPVPFLLDIAIVLASIVTVVGVTQATRKIPVQYAKRVVGRRVYGGQSTHLPMKLIQAG